MSRKLLEKNRNRFLQQQYPENLLPNKRIQGKIAEQYNISAKFSYHLRKQPSICNQWAFSWDELEKKIRKNQNSFYYQNTCATQSPGEEKPHSRRERYFPYSALTSQGVTFSHGNAIVFILSLFHKEKLSNTAALSEIRKSSQGVYQLNTLLTQETSRVVGGNIVFLSNNLLSSLVASAPGQQSRVEGSYSAHSPTVQTNSTRKSFLQETGKIFHLYPLFYEANSKLSFLGQTPNLLGRGSTTFLSLPALHRGRAQPLRQEKECKNRLFFKLRWQLNSPTVAGFVQQQLDFNCWNSLFSFSEIDKGKKEKTWHLRKKQYTEFKKVTILYGNLPKRVLARAMQHALKEAQGGFNLDVTFFSRLEKRLDVCLKRISFFPTIDMARQWIHQGRIWVNQQPCTTSAYLLQPADVIAIKPSARQLWQREWHYYYNTISVARLHKLLAREYLSLNSVEKRKGIERIPQKKENNRDHVFSPKTNLTYPKQVCKQTLLYFSIAEKLRKKTVDKGCLHPFNPWHFKEKQKEKAGYYHPSNPRGFPFFPPRLKGERCGVSKPNKVKKTPVLSTLMSRKGLVWGSKHSLFPPRLMKKWHKWGELWGNCTAGNVSAISAAPIGPSVQQKGMHLGISHIADVATQKTSLARNLDLTFRVNLSYFYNNWHRWGVAVEFKTSKKTNIKENDLSLSEIEKKLKQKCKDLHPFFNSSCLAHFRDWKNLGLAGGLNQAQLIYRRETIVTRWLKRFAMHERKPTRFGFSETNQKNINVFRAKLLLALLMHQQQMSVVDGLYSLRLGKVLTKAKCIRAKRYGWQFSCLKPLHVECSLKHASAIFLYAPQKVAWPTNINVVWLQQHLNR